MAIFCPPSWLLCLSSHLYMAKYRSSHLSIPLCALLLAGEDDIYDVISAVIKLAGKWKDLGIALGVHPSDLDAIQSDYPHSSSDCLRETLLKWLRQNYHVCIPHLYSHLAQSPLVTTSSLIAKKILNTNYSTSAKLLFQRYLGY